jgi:hypothetical protein
MVRLALTQPGPFASERELGRYIGIREDGVLVAMAGERLRLDGYTRSAPLLHAPHRAATVTPSALVSQLVQEIVARGRHPSSTSGRRTAIRSHCTSGSVSCARRRLYVFIVTSNPPRWGVTQTA